MAVADYYSGDFWLRFRPGLLSENLETSIFLVSLLSPRKSLETRHCCLPLFITTHYFPIILDTANTNSAAHR